MRLGEWGHTWAIVGGVWGVSATMTASMVSACLVRAAVEVISWVRVAWAGDGRERMRGVRSIMGCILRVWVRCGTSFWDYVDNFLREERSSRVLRKNVGRNERDGERVDVVLIQDLSVCEDSGFAFVLLYAPVQSLVQ